MAWAKKRITLAFTMLELVFVIVVLGIVSSMGADMIAKVYRNYILQKAHHSASIKTELAVLQAVNRLQNSLRYTLTRIKSDGSMEPAMTTVPSGDDYIGIEWVGYDYESFSAKRGPGWSGFCDVQNSSASAISTPGSDLNFSDTVIKNLSSGSKSLSDAVVYFAGDTSYRANGVDSSSDGENLVLDDNASFISEHYKLAWSSYALIVEDGNLYLYYNFSPLPGAQRGNDKALLLKNVTTFKMKVVGDTIRIKICKEERISENADDNISACKEKVVF